MFTRTEKGPCSPRTGHCKPFYIKELQFDRRFRLYADASACGWRCYGAGRACRLTSEHWRSEPSTRAIADGIYEMGLEITGADGGSLFADQSLEALMVRQMTQANVAS